MHLSKSQREWKEKFKLKNVENARFEEDNKNEFSIMMIGKCSKQADEALPE